MKKFWHKVEAGLKKLFGSSTWEKVAAGTLTYIAPLAETLALLAGGTPARPTPKPRPL